MGEWYLDQYEVWDMTTMSIFESCIAETARGFHCFGV